MAARLPGHRGSVVVCIAPLSVAVHGSAGVRGVARWGGAWRRLDLWGVWFEAGGARTGWKPSGDLLTAGVPLTVTGVSLAVHPYAGVYMRADRGPTPFLSTLSPFTFFMLVLATADNLVGMLVGWEGIGVCSYSLILYWSHRLSAVKSAGKAIGVNRISDGVLMWGVVWIWHHTGALEVDPLLMSASVCTPSRLVLVSVLSGAMGKSAQMLFHVWLADAMEGPTPVSALIHAATLVTAGVYLMVRLAPFPDDPVILVGGLTASTAGVFGAFGGDPKRVIAFSTCSQLGLMMVSVGLGELGAEASMSHLMTHAGFKAALFLAAGPVIGVSGGHQHVARYGALSGVHTSPVAFTALVLASSGLVGWPELSGFYSKETILNLSVRTAHALSTAAHTLLLLTAFLTSCYSSKPVFRGFVMDSSGRGFGGPSSRGASTPPTLAMVLLLTDVVLKVWVGAEQVSGVVPFVPWGVKTSPAGLTLSGVLTAPAGTAIPMSRLHGTRWGFDQMFSRLLVNATLDWGRLALCGLTGGFNHSPHS